MNIPYIPAKARCIAGSRTYASVKYIIIHYTGISNDSAKNEAVYFSSGIDRDAGAHFFVGQDGVIYQSIKMSQIARSVPRKRQAYKGGGSLVGICTSANSVSIEMCDNLTKDPSAKQTEAVRQLVAYIQSVCPNAKTIVRHYDATGKLCPARMTDVYKADAQKWLAFKAAIIAKPKEEPKQEVEDLTRDETIKLFDELIEKKLGGNGLPVSSWAEESAEKAKSLGITDGTRPQGVATREQVWKMIVSALTLKALT